jgi:hypothetical protein
MLNSFPCDGDGAAQGSIARQIDDITFPGRHISHSIGELTVAAFYANPERSHGISTTTRRIPQIHFRRRSKKLGMRSRRRSLYRRKMANK